MLLQCETPVPGCESWLRAATLANLAELNEACLALCARQAHAGSGHALLHEIGRGLEALERGARGRLADTPCLLLDAGLSDGALWREPTAAPAEPCFTLPEAGELAQDVFAFTWYLAQCQPAAAQLLLGMPARAVAACGQLTLSRGRALALARQGVLRPRWAQRPAVWRELLRAAAGTDAEALARARLRGQRLLAAEAYRALIRPTPARAAASAPPRLPAAERPGCAAAF